MVFLRDYNYARQYFRQTHEHPLSQERSSALVLLRKIYANCRNFDLLQLACSTSLIGGMLQPDRRIEVKRDMVLERTVETSGNKQRMGQQFPFGSINGYSYVCAQDRAKADNWKNIRQERQRKREREGGRGRERGGGIKVLVTIKAETPSHLARMEKGMVNV